MFQSLNEIHHKRLERYSNCSIEAIYRPFDASLQNSVDPCFVYSFTLIVNSLLGAFAAYQLLKSLFYNSHGPFRIHYALGSSFKIKSVGGYQILKLILLFLHSTALMLLAFYNFTSLTSMLFFATASSFGIFTLIILPFHIIEPTRTVTANSSLLLYWIIILFLNLSVLVQDVFSGFKLYIPISGNSSKSLVYVLETFLFINSAIVLFLETSLFKPSVELRDYYSLNGWEISSVRNMISQITFSWLEDLIKKIYDTDELDIKDIPPVPIELKNDTSFNKLARKLRDLKLKYKQTSKPSLLYILISIHFWDLLIAGTLDFGESFFGFIQAFLFQRFIAFFSENQAEVNKQPAIVSFAYATGIFVCAVLRFASSNQYFAVFYSVRCEIQGSLSTMIFRKALDLSPESKKTKTTGEIVNNLSVDVNAICEMPRLVELITAPLKLIFTMLSLYKIIGISSLSGFVVTVVFVPITGKVSAFVMRYVKENMKYKDKRTKLTSEILSSVKSIKLYSWENPMLERLFKIRNDQELVLTKKIGILNSCSMMLWTIIPILVPLSCLVTFVFVSKVPLVPAVCFPALSLFEILSRPIVTFPEILNNFFNMRISLQRLSDFFELSELESAITDRSYKELKKNDVSIKINNATFLWNEESDKDYTDEDRIESDGENNVALSEINFEARKGQLTCIVGKVGSGKTTLLKSILGELILIKKNNTKLEVNGTIAYCSQAPWILNSSVKENILFGCKYDKSFYAKTIAACQLLPDFDALPDGDKTIVGEKGISLSGGQKARISFARAVYARADIYLLDDVLSAVDAHVGKNLVDQVLGKNGIIASKTIVLATNAVKVLHEADNIVLLKKGEITEGGNYEEVIAKNDELAVLIREFGQQEAEEELEELEDEIKKDFEPEVDVVSVGSTLQDDNIIELNASNVKNHIEVDIPLEVVDSISSLRRASMTSLDHEYQEEDEQDETIVRRTEHVVEKGAKGRVKLEVYWEYFKAANVIDIFIIIFLMNLSTVSQIMSGYALKSWSQDNLDAGQNVSSKFYLILYSLLGGITTLGTFGGSILGRTKSSIRASKHFHDNMARNVLRSPMSFFDTTPVGRILNRFSEDMNVIDDQLTFLLFGVLRFGSTTIGILAVIIFNFPVMIIVISVLFFFYNKLREYYIPSARELKRLASAYRSPVYSHLQESVTGVETIRAYDQINRFVNGNKIKLDRLISTNFAALSCGRWLSMRLQAISAVVVYATTLVILSTLGTSHELDSGLVGFVMMNALSITGTLNAMIRLWAEVEARSVAIERIIEYCKLKPEAPLVISDNRPREAWPESGSISFKNYSTKYRDNLDPVLKDLNIDIKAREKIGIVGRTGAGKSTVAISMFRIIEPSQGHIEIDGVDTSKMGLFDLRHRINIIPQDAQTIEGSVRENLDPFGEFEDEELWNVLEMSHLKEHVQDMKTKKNVKKKQTEVKVSDDSINIEDISDYDMGLDAVVFEGGSNLSSGQKQLLSLARALLNKSQILILDEATAAVDVQTDKIIQETIRSSFKDKTILTIAHRLETILDSDRILVLHDGQVKEFDTPKNLLKDDTSEFYSLCNKGGYLKNLDIENL
ncbi:hypothetical protein DFJ63DRAFT_337473 [Scheffersomyces coipomensis]|uniref:uncharacterized protein n=1 Tax=Scheffersomyces coipomensis TaxID=1788519 RepID=UPI00315DFD1D